MMKYINKMTLHVSAAFLTGLMTSGFTQDALAFGGSAPRSGGGFKSVTGNVTDSVENLPNLIATVAYLGGAGLGVAGVLKLKQHVDAPGQVPLKDGVARVAAGGALLATPAILEAMLTSFGDANSSQVNVPKINTVTDF